MGVQGKSSKHAEQIKAGEKMQKRIQRKGLAADLPPHICAHTT